MADSRDSLFSLELVVEKLYVPYVTCRFPAVAFRLLDFPTILISHVESELANKIKHNIKSDPYYKIPNQFSELQDKHGNFIMKKGKSCLFKIPLDTLAIHLANTPLYIMVIDEFLDVPKLLGNSSLALSETMTAICHDAQKNGNTVPSVHGDKGLFKINNLMGKEIGYVILGFRLLSLGPGLIPHLPTTAVAKRASEKYGKIEQNVVDEIVEVKQSVHQTLGAAKLSGIGQSRNTHEKGSMTRIDQQDALMQTVDIDDHHHVAKIEDQRVTTVKKIKAKYTQTDNSRAKKVVDKLAYNGRNAYSSDESEDEVLLNPNISCPPPLYYNSKAKPAVHINRDYLADVDQKDYSQDDITVEDLSSDEHYDKVIEGKLKKENTSNYAPSKVIQYDRVQQSPNTNGTEQVNQIEEDNNKLSIFNSTPDKVFPLLTALLTELAKIQNPELVSQAMKNVQVLSEVAKKQSEISMKKHTPEVQRTNFKPDLESNKEHLAKEKESKKKRKSHSACAQPPDGVPKQKGWIRKQPEVGVKKTKLVFGLTNTQRLRLAKGNPVWLKSAEQDEKLLKAEKLKQKEAKVKEDNQDLETGNLSDTYTEVRRLAAAELEKSASTPIRYRDDSHHDKKVRRKQKSRDNSPAKSKSKITRRRSPKYRNAANKKISQLTGSGEESDDVKEPVNLEPDIQNIVSPDLPVGGEKLDSAVESIPSSHIEVHIPSARAYDSDSEATLSNDSDLNEYENIIERKVARPKFSGFNKVEDTLPDSINGDENKDISVTLDEDSPLESTRVSKQFQKRTVAGESELFKSTEDYDTTGKQFHSTDEPELQKLMSEDEGSEQSESKGLGRNVIPKPDRTLSPASNKGTSNRARISMNFEVINPTVSQQSPLPAIRRSQMKIDSLNARPSPTNTPRSRSSQERSRSSQGSPKQQTPRPLKPLRERRLELKKESIHTESVSSYVPSESENILSLISDGSYSDDFHMSSEKEDKSSRLSTPELPKLIPSTKLGFTIH